MSETRDEEKPDPGGIGLGQNAATGGDIVAPQSNTDVSSRQAPISNDAASQLDADARRQWFERRRAYLRGQAEALISVGKAAQ